MRLFGEKVEYTISDSPLNNLQVQDYCEIFFGVFEIVINNNKYPVEKISEHNGNPVVSIPVEMGDKTVNRPFILTKGEFEVIFNEQSDYVDIFESKLEELPMEEEITIVEEFQIQEPIFLEDENNDFISQITEEFSDILNEENDLKFSKKIKILECGEGDIKISPSNTLNILQVLDYDEIFFNVYNISVNGKSFQVERVDEYLKNPIVSIEIQIDEEYRKYPFLLVKGESFHVFFNEQSNFDMLDEILVEHLEEEIEECVVIEEVEPVDIPLVVDYDRELLVREINDTKRKAYNLVNRKLEENKNKNLKLIKDKAESWEQKLKTTVSESRENLLAEFLHLIEEANRNILDKNESTISDIKLNIDEKLGDTVNILCDNINKNIKNAETTLQSNISKEIPKIYKERVEPFLLKERSDLFKLVDQRIKNGQRIIDKNLEEVSSILDNITDKTEQLCEHLEDKAVDIELTLQNLINENIKIIESKNDKFYKDTLSKIGNINKNVHKIHEDFGKTVIKSKLDLKEFVDEQIKTLEEETSGIKNSLSKIDDLDVKTERTSKKLKEDIDNVKKSTLSVLNEKLKTIEDANKKLSKENVARDNITSTKIGAISKELRKKITDTESAIKQLFSEKIEAVEDFNKNLAEGVDLKNHELSQRINETSEILNEKINDVGESISEFFNEKIKLLEEESTSWKQENDQWRIDSRDEFINIFEEARDTLINEVSQLKNDQYIIDTPTQGVENKDWKIFKKDFEQKIDKKFESYKTELRKYIVYSSGGGTVAMQFADGGTMNGDLNVNGNVTIVGTISASQYLGLPSGGGGGGSDVSGLSANWQNTYTTVQANSAAWTSGGSDAYKYTWSFLSLTWSVEPTIVTSLSSGDVYTYSLSGVDRYRFVPSPYNATSDSFYSSFDGVNLSGLIITRG